MEIINITFSVSETTEIDNKNEIEIINETFYKTKYLVITTKYNDKRKGVHNI